MSDIADQLTEELGNMNTAIEGKGGEPASTLSGVSTSINELSTSITDDSVYTNAIQDGAVTSAKINSDLLNILKGVNGAIVNVKDYGATGDGVTDDAAAIQDAIEYSRTNGGVVFFPKGIYLLSTALFNASNIGIASALMCYDGQTLKGEEATLKVGATGVTHTIFTYNASGATGYIGAKNITINGLIFESNSALSSSITHVNITHTDNIVVKNCRFYNGRSWHYIEINSSQNVMIDNCYFGNYQTPSASFSECIQLDAATGNGNLGSNDSTVCKDVIIKGNVFNTNVAAIGNHSDYPHSNIRICSNVFKGGANTRTYINFVASTKFIDVYNNTFYGNGTVFNNTSKSNTVHDNRFESVTTAITGGVAYSNMINNVFEAGELKGNTDFVPFTGYIVESATDVKSLPSNNATTVTTLNQDTKVNVVSEQNGFYFVEYTNGCGYVEKAGITTEEPKELPTGYTEVKGLIGSGAQWIETDYIPTKTTKLTLLNFKRIASNVNYQGYIGSQSADNASDTFAIRQYQTSTIIDYQRSQNGALFDNGYKATEVAKIVAQGRFITFDGSQKSIRTDNFAAGVVPLVFFGMKQGNDIVRTSKAQLGRITIEDGGAVLHDYIPCLDDNNKPCYYDMVTEQTLYNSGTGDDFTYETL